MPTFNTNADTDWVRHNVVVQKRVLFRSCVVANKNAAQGFWLWVCDSNNEGAAKPSMAPLWVPPLSSQSIDRSYSPRRMYNGIYVVATTDPVVKTLPATNDAYFEVDYDV